MKYLTFLMIILFSTSLYSVERPSAVPPPLDDEDNPTYYMAYGNGDRIDPSTNKPLNLIQIYCKEEGNVMPAFGMNPNVAPHINDIYRYVKARADGKIRRGVRLPKLPKFKE